MPGIWYGSLKFHNKVIHNYPKFRSILSTIGTPTYIAKFLVPILSPLTVNEFSVHDSFYMQTRFLVFVLSISWLVLMLKVCVPIFL